MVAAAPIVKPVMTGIEIKRTSTPRFKRPSRQMMQPTRKALNGAKSALWRAYGWTISAIIDVVAAR